MARDEPVLFSYFRLAEAGAGEMIALHMVHKLQSFLPRLGESKVECAVSVEIDPNASGHV